MLPKPQIEMRDVFRILQFREDSAGPTDNNPSYEYKDDSIEIRCAEVFSLSLRPVFHIGGYVRTSRTLKYIDFDCPMEVDCLEQGIALIAHAIGEHEQPERIPIWLSLGRKWKGSLPWLAKPRT